MKVRICPMCDQPMKKAHRCDSCNSFVWKPQYLDIHYNTETMYGEDCSYDTKNHDYKYQDNGSVTMMPSDDERRTNKRKFRGIKEIEFPAYDTYRDSSQQSTADQTQKKGGCLKTLVIIFTVITIISTIVELIGVFVFDVSSNTIPEPEISIESEIVEDWADDWFDEDTERIDFTVEEVLSGGSECTGSDHMDVTLDEFTMVFEPLASERGSITGGLEGYSEGTDNYAYDYAGSSSYTYFNTYRTYAIDNSIGYYYDISWDTYSGRLHEVAYDVYDSVVAEEFYVITMEALCGDGEAHRVEFQKQRTIAEEESYVFYETEGYEVYISYYDGSDGYEISYYISIVKAI